LEIRGKLWLDFIFIPPLLLNLGSAHRDATDCLKIELSKIRNKLSNEYLAVGSVHISIHLELKKKKTKQSSKGSSIQDNLLDYLPDLQF
jgi:hypothetical protein